MKKVFLTLSFLAMSLTFAQVTPEFDKRLKDNQLTFDYPKSFENVPVIENAQMPYDFAIKMPNKDFEVRYRIVQALEGKNITAKDIDAYTLIAASNIGGVNKANRIMTLSSNDVKNEFNADFGSVTITEVKGDFTKNKYKYCYLVTLAKDKVATVYIMYLGNNVQEFRSLMDPIINSLKFK
ncbi:hypothetical protein [Ornithobacterium rhinotracheale]|uniref:DUF4252 domain-containing protein n=2 Tax=Ornithobacterium rhinotracheale TaxID=28251 RepID=I3ZX49_ORNRL|nr:hypothetical protein [Ornithobacterium rhinotracheale]AFL96283.1 hypothetical protein Ornrh_0052 [Ornithobacterium rhinotracheale DSM 15997]AIQ00232.1 hypothetical protein Q785_00260 [Ornithobacterium rhinotracheale ORT-UMN 88]KGB67945.1 hypothetical protein Q787_00260 [Ornithobacterium rhinotracheale H06-030791]MCK0193107.1 hypothetical protein [Ornithobacterium rhinotracheale]MCK0200973.1 hypothetical protein [Ornithobacterium rhinotracheale]